MLAALVFVALTFSSAPAHAIPSQQATDAFVARAMQATGSKGLALAVIDGDKVSYVRSYGVRNAKGEPLETQTIMYGASVTKAVFAYYVMMLVDEGKFTLDTPIDKILPKPLPGYTAPEVEDKYARWSDLKGDERWRKLTPRLLLAHSSGFANFGFLEPDGKLKFHFDPGARYGYSGDGLILLQFVIETAFGVDIGKEMTSRVFKPLGMTNTDMMWRADFAKNLADGFDIDGKVEPHDERSTPRAAGSMDTTIEDMAKFAAAYVNGVGVSKASRAALTTPSIPITIKTQFPTLQPELPVAQRRKDFGSALSVIVFDGPQGRAFHRGGHNDTTGNTWLCIEASKRCVVILSNDVRSEAAFPALARFILGETGVPYDWVLGELKFWEP
jgi:CubicO group peptidase (beta-lactamase class C family)